MALFQIAEPDEAQPLVAKTIAVGIDLGTTHSLVATVDGGGQPYVLHADDESPLVPSVVRYLGKDKVDVGMQAHAVAGEDPVNTISSIKRLLGRAYDEIESGAFTGRLQGEAGRVPRIHTDYQAVNAVEVSAQILLALKRRAGRLLDAMPETAVITVPAYFDDAQRQATKDAARLAGLQVLRLLNEPTAAAIAYGLDKKTEGTVAVYDLGGGTFDISILRMYQGVFEVLATAGDTALGGDDFDECIIAWLREKFSLTECPPSLWRRLQQAATQAKLSLSETDSTIIKVQIERDRSVQCVLCRAEFEQLIIPLVNKTLSPCRRAVQDAGLALTDIDAVVLVGGSTRVPLVRKQVEDFFRQTSLSNIDPDQVVALGAAIQADILSGNRRDQDVLLLDVIPLSLGIETMGGLVEKIIPRNATLPVARAQTFTTFKSGQTAMMLHVLQGERELVSDCRSLARFELRGIPPLAAGAAHIEVRFQVDADGLLSVSAKELSSGVQTEINVKPSFGLTDDEIEAMLRDSMQHVEQDVQDRRLKEQQVEAQRVLQALTAAIQMDGLEMVRAEEAQAINQAYEDLRRLQDSSDAEAIKVGIRALETACRPYVSKRVNKSLQDTLAGRHIGEYSEL